ncbi:uncharacterized protein SPPG_07462 [Spizellomyces punctatus DAOM BR117]|uniref:Uncharacterized protein n=1 Tax=Spizellomyces punctatus (strain DAOM BR117) TaxID=645134 RepID=A0A0L0H6H2_SPIPD|nr:uncharacterized protein SPPG_07462 [Spizellomyces punctatus DAOM BR117]KNC97065.1 hypothetical protein SPPG_07462 [Spizellomyces punctatus DAOM BR117]|eukprot:XP_016605105.1 hypothetical protein SPPG_07462 [Spizellomyces punctatus DAOM BR117]
MAEGSILSGKNPLTDPVALFLLQALIIIVLSRLLAILLGYVRQPRVIAEVIGGILLGPSVLSRSAAFKENVFPTSSIPRLSLIANFALIFFLFLVGLELDPRTLMKKAKQSAFISISGIAVPFAVGVGVSKAIYDTLADKTVPFYSFFVFCGVAMSITAFPVLARILTELKLLQTTVGQVTLASAAVDDGVAWCLLILVVALINNPSDSVTAVYVFLLVVAWGLFLVIAVRPLLAYIVRRGADNDHISHLSVLATFIVILGSSWFTQAAGVHAIFGGFLAGLITPHDHGFAIKLTEKIEDFVTILLLPLYFALSGLNTNIGTLSDGQAWGYTILVILVACGGKVVGCTAAAKFTGFNWRESFAVGFLMNTKGLVELIVLNLGYEAGVINQKIFSMFVIMALVTTFMTTPIISFIYPPQFYTHIRRAASHDTLSMSRSHHDLEKHEWESNSNHERGGIQVLLCLPNMATVPAMMSVTQMFQTTRSSLSVFALRLIRLTERTSTYMMAANEGETMRADPVINVFRTFGQLNRVSVHTLVTVSPPEDFPSNIVETSVDSKINLILLPWQQPPGESRQSCMNDHFVKDVVEAAPCSVAVFVDRGFGVSSTQVVEPSATIPGQNQHVFVPFFGTEDDREALRFVAQLASHPGLSVTVLRVRVQGDNNKDLSSATLAIDVLHSSSSGEATSESTLNDTSISTLTNINPTNVSVENINTTDALSAVTSRGNAFGRKDLIVVGHDTYATLARMAGGTLKKWVDEDSASSVVIVKRHETRNLDDSSVKEK